MLSDFVIWRQVATKSQRHKIAQKENKYFGEKR